jgi:hypothetical protein
LYVEHLDFQYVYKSTGQEWFVSYVQFRSNLGRNVGDFVLFGRELGMA